MSARPAMRSFTPETRSAFSDGGWQLRARCRGASTDMFYPPENTRGNTRRLNERPAKQVCESCPVLVPCRRYAVDAQ
jgi:WhiB family redox-sensing transcriptional regulator